MEFWYSLTWLVLHFWWVYPIVCIALIVLLGWNELIGKKTPQR